MKTTKNNKIREGNKPNTTRAHKQHTRSAIPLQTLCLFKTHRINNHKQWGNEEKKIVLQIQQKSTFNNQNAQHSTKRHIKSD